MKFPLYQLDAFTSRLFGGNPAAVVMLDEWLPDSVLAAIAGENNLAETAYVIPRSGISPLRWFTPTDEIDLCGHATLAAADVLFRYRFPALDRLIFSTRSGELAVTRDGALLKMDFPARPGKSIGVTDSLVSALGARPREAFLARDLLAIFDSESEVRSLRVDMQRIASLDAFAVITSAPGDAVDFVSRFFAPGAGTAAEPAVEAATRPLLDGRRSSTEHGQWPQPLALRPFPQYVLTDRCGSGARIRHNRKQPFDLDSQAMAGHGPKPAAHVAQSQRRHWPNIGR